MRRFRWYGCAFLGDYWTRERASLRALLHEGHITILSNSAFVHANVECMPADPEIRSRARLCSCTSPNGLAWKLNIRTKWVISAQ